MSQLLQKALEGLSKYSEKCNRIQIIIKGLVENFQAFFIL